MSVDYWITTPQQQIHFILIIINLPLILAHLLSLFNLWLLHLRQYNNWYFYFISSHSHNQCQQQHGLWPWWPGLIEGREGWKSKLLVWEPCWGHTAAQTVINQPLALTPTLGTRHSHTTSEIWISSAGSPCGRFGTKSVPAGLVW